MTATTVPAVDAPPMTWSVVGRDAQGAARVQIGAHRIDASEVAGLTAYGRDDRDIDGPLLGFSAYLIAATLVAIGVFVMGWRERFLLFTGLISAISLMSLQDVFLTRPIRTYCLEIRLLDGRRVTFVHPDAAEVGRLRDLLAQRPSAAA